jgi:hypothetical protein
VQVTHRVKHLARKKKFGVRDRLVEIISEAERIWGRPVIRPSDAEEVRQESAPSSEGSVEERDEDVSTPRDKAFVEDFVEEGTPRTPSSERPRTPPPPSCDCKMGNATPQEPCTAPDQTEPQMGTPERVNTEEPGSSQQVRVQNTPGAGLEVRSVDQSEASQHLGEPEGSRFNTEASTSELRPNESEAAPTMKAIPSVGPSSSSRLSAGFEVLGRGLLGHPMEAIKNLIPEGFLGNAGASSPEKIAQGILISHY